MGTRGVTGFRYQGKDRIAYQQFDSYPEGVGLQCVNELHELLKDRPKTEAAIKKLKRVVNTIKPTALQVKKLAPFTDLTVSEGSTTDWYCLLRHTQGHPVQILEAGYHGDHAGFLADSLFCEWGYILNFDDNVLEVYLGFQKAAHKRGRYADLPVEEEHQGKYWPVALLDAIPFELVASDLETARTRMLALNQYNDPDVPLPPLPGAKKRKPAQPKARK